MRMLIINGTVIQWDKIEKANVLIEEGTIVSTKAAPDTDADKIIDADGLYVLPGLIDAHCHLRDPDSNIRKTWYRVQKCSQRGFTSIACMPNTNRLWIMPL